MVTEEEANRATEVVVAGSILVPLFAWFILTKIFGTTTGTLLATPLMVFGSFAMVYTLNKHQEGEMWE